MRMMVLGEEDMVVVGMFGVVLMSKVVLIMDSFNVDKQKVIDRKVPTCLRHAILRAEAGVLSCGRACVLLVFFLLCRHSHANLSIMITMNTSISYARMRAADRTLDLPMLANT